MGPSLAPVGNRRCDTNNLPDDEEPEHMSAGSRWCKSSTERRTQYRNHDEERRAYQQRRVGRYMSPDKIPGKKVGQQWVRCNDENNRKYVAPGDYANGSAHGKPHIEGWIISTISAAVKPPSRVTPERIA